MQSPSDINDESSSGPVSLSQILEREVYIPDAGPSESSAVSALSDTEKEVAIQSSTDDGDSDVKGVNDSGFTNIKVVESCEGVGGTVHASACGCVGDIVRGYIQGSGHVDQNNSGTSMYTSSGYKLPPLSCLPRSEGSQFLGSNMGNGTSVGHSSQSSTKSDKFPNSPSNTRPNMPFGSSSKLKDGGVAYSKDYIYMKEKLQELKEQMKEDSLRLEMHQAENSSLKRDLRAKNDEITQLKRENHKLKVSGNSCYNFVMFIFYIIKIFKCNFYHSYWKSSLFNIFSIILFMLVNSCQQINFIHVIQLS